MRYSQNSHQDTEYSCVDAGMIIAWGCEPPGRHISNRDAVIDRIDRIDISANNVQAVCTMVHALRGSHQYTSTLWATMNHDPPEAPEFCGKSVIRES